MDASEVLLFVHAKYWSNFTSFEHIALYALTVYDWLIWYLSSLASNALADPRRRHLSLEQEISLVLSPGLSPAKLAYLLSRYWPLLTYPVGIWVNVMDHSHAECGRIFKAPMLVQVGNFVGAALIMAIRVHAFTGQRMSVAILLTASIVVIVMYQLWVAATQAGLAPRGCYVVDIGPAKHLSGYLLAPMLFDCMAMLFILIHALRAIPRHLWIASVHTRVFLRDGLGYFLIIFALHAFNAAMSFQPDEAISGVGIPASILLPSILTCRVVLNLRAAVAQEDEETLPLRSDSVFDAKAPSELTSPGWSSVESISLPAPAYNSDPYSSYRDVEKWGSRI
ncbi:hypothetical protein AURDEDRAFT_161587 [Auricularia subglabra TFB-10046 SS5]|nr:hypothetical protein AURDEDRAFT_161587 [Auricularia subglabra TFB-10046 SS5]